MNQKYIDRIDAWHAQRIESLVGESGWLNLVGLFWLQEGHCRFGTDPSNEVRFPEGTGSEHMGVFELEDGRVSIRINPGIEVLCGKEKLVDMVLSTDAEGEPTRLSHGSMQFYVIERDGQFGVRLRDLDSPKVRGFRGIERFEVDRKWEIKAAIDLYSQPKKFSVPTVLGNPGERQSPGALRFEIDGNPYSLDPIGEMKDDRLFLIIADATTGITTYSGGRYMWIDTPGQDGTTIIDFNKAYNPPCVFTDFAACPLPPEQNKLPIAVTAGEKIYSKQ